jgi:hypothetical protein
MSTATARKPRTRKTATAVVPLTVPAVVLERALSNALVFAGTDDTLPVLAAVLVTVDATGLACYATDRYAMIRERIDVDGTTKPGGVVIPRGSVELLVVALRKHLRTRVPSERDQLDVILTVSPRDGSPHAFVPDSEDPCSLYVMCGSHALTVTGIAGGFPDCDSLIDKKAKGDAGPFAVALNPTFLARVAKVATGVRHGAWHFTQPAPMKPVRAVPVFTDGTVNPRLVVLVMPVRTATASAS